MLSTAVLGALRDPKQGLHALLVSLAQIAGADAALVLRPGGDKVVCEFSLTPQAPVRPSVLSGVTVPQLSSGDPTELVATATRELGLYAPTWTGGRADTG